MQNKYLKVMFGNKGANYVYKIGKVNIANTWNPQAKKSRDFGGFNFSTEDKIIRWLHRGDTIYDVEVPDDAEVVDVVESATPHGVFRSNKIIISNPRKVTDEMALHFYKISTIPEIAYYKALGAVCLMNYHNTALAILKDKVNSENIDLVLSEWNDFINLNKDENRNNANELTMDVNEWLLEIKSNLSISRFVDKPPYLKKITKDKVINITGESGSGKSYYSKQYMNNNKYIVIDTDLIFSNEETNNQEILKMRDLFKEKTKDYLITNFDECYLKILTYYKDTNKTIVIDSAQYRNIKDYSILKGEIIVIRTSIETCYKRCLDRWKYINKDFSNEEYQKYISKKMKVFDWYKSLNKFINKIAEL